MSQPFARAICALVMSLWLVALPLPSRADHVVFIDFNFIDAPNTGFLDPVLGPARRDALFFAADTFGAFFQSGFPGQTTIVDVRFDALPTLFGLSTVSHAAVNIGLPQLPQIGYPLVLLDHLAGPFDLAPQRILFDSDTNFFLGTQGDPGGLPDFVTVAMHEFGHLFGFSSLMQSDGTYLGGTPSLFDTFLGDANGSRLVFKTPEERLALATGGDTVFWLGAKGIAANGGVPPNISAGMPFEPSSNLWHISETFFDPAVLMDALIETRIHDLHPVERGMYEDLGWRLIALQEVSEPGSVALIVLALGLIAVRRRQRVDATACTSAMSLITCRIAAHRVRTHSSSVKPTLIVTCQCATLPSSM